MRVVDANVLLYAVNEDAPQHDASREWLDRALSGEDTVGFAWVAMLAFARLSTRGDIFAHPLSPGEAFSQLDDWVCAPGGRVVHPGERHLGILSSLLAELGLGGNLVNGAHLAALALEHRASVVSYDSDFTRFSGLRSHTPAQLLR
ncbi:type II toxin-antitoxin system VapC family toxin [Microbacterium sp.]|uniref:type II toxin-antitoxin system VapC family toxin n=1 Tax=Microbacterium sp. TaxID=51671 RepID=UPI0039E5748D